jgi:L-amino acid N-acyltransferase YncA
MAGKSHVEPAGDRDKSPHAAATIHVRDAGPADFAEIAAIYAHFVQSGTASFEEVAPSAEELRRRFDAVKRRGLPYRVAMLGEALVGYAYASPFRARSAYRYSVENSVYVDHGHHSRGIGLALMRGVIAECAVLGYRQMIAVIGDSANEGSIRLHTRLGFRTIGQEIGVGLKFGRWLDVVQMQLPLGEGTRTAPTSEPIGYVRE